MYSMLVIDDNPEDRVLIIRKLRRELPQLHIEEVKEAEGLNQALSAGNFDVVVTDYQLRWNDGITVLQEVKSRYPNCPVIMFTDSGNQEIAVEAMKTGLDDYIVKSPKNFVRLSAAVRAALERAESKRKAERLEIRLQTLLNRLNVGVFRSTLNGCLLEGNAAFLRLLGVSSLEEAQTLDWQELFRQPDVAVQFLNQGHEVQLRRADGSAIWVLLSQTISTTESEPVIEGLIEDITELKLAQEALQRANEELESRVAERTQSLQQVNEQLLAEIRERQQAQESLHESEERYRQLVELSPDAIFINSGGQFVFVNSASVKLFGATSASELIGTAIMDRIHPDYQESAKARIRQIVEERTPVQLMEYKFFKLDGTVIDVEVQAAPFTYQQQPAAQVVVRDIGDRKRAEEELRKALETERELSEFKSRIITTISHEYRTPLTAILSSAELLQSYSQKWSEEKKQVHFQRIQTSGKRLTELVDDVLFFSQADADRVTFNPAPLDLKQVCQEFVEEMSSISKNQIALTFLSRGNCTKACLDEKLLRQILSNLVSNAIKYSPKEGTVRFSLDCMEDVARFHIQDEGIGIPAEDLPQLFQSFYRAGNVGTIPGTGLGLAIAKKCVDLHGGHITVDSVVNRGTTFTVTLPL